jgi:NTE family protein
MEGIPSRTTTICVVPPLCPVDVSPYDFTRAGGLIDRASRSTREWLDDGGLARRGAPLINCGSMRT